DLAAGAEITEQECRTMCWFVDGVRERANPNDLESALIPAKVPSASHVGQQGEKGIAVGRSRMPANSPEILVDLGGTGSSWDCDSNSAAPE
ncbi:MAG: hypothetical protein FWD57_11585, partial [Polyangiaceae bacterium]|nr:hypothetical protein [Polyangiaceae bacterium]